MEDGELEETTQVAKFADTLGAARVTKGVMLNEVVVEALLDTGATTSIVSMDLARQLGLEEAGAGAIRGLFTRKQVTLFKASLATKDRRMKTVLYSSKELKDDELILGVPDMIALGIFDACKCQFHVESCCKVNAVSLVDEEKSDQDLLAVAKQLITDMTSHLEGVVRERLWGLLQKHSKCWLRPRTGRTRHSVEFEVDGNPVKHTLKPLRPELREELDKQTC
ncbi:aspartyl protease [Gregarina niphandrodes]|uniref:Aspartyl protease n=2 Tax=Gregarina niphandrodes TaxID=110365 RepID=A0A023B0L5_GRENI|nr:aspartyl protease [Gregarina niphandrodes]EZG44598.1 aspartyl protease [Gregarina niphandrodes]|eukprot:XP_011134149.1 aspartyl protease [Gregarina niphandrodes]